MTSGRERWGRVKAILADALDMPRLERAEFLRQACGGDSELQGEVESLLAQEDSAAFFPLEPVSPAAMPDQVGLYRVERELGRGGMGVVYLVSRSDGAFERKAALKIIKRGMDTESIQARFRAERQLLARLQHPNIAALFDGGTTPDGLAYFVMEYVDGQPLDRFSEPLRVRGKVQLFLQVCAAVEYAHANLVLHRDIKAGNILVGADGVPKLLDFGIAKVLSETETQELTRTGLQLFTPQVASPEQKQGQALTTATDVYSLGRLLGNLLQNSQPDRDLQLITGNATQEDASRRYSSVSALAADLRRWLAAEPILARADSFAYRLGKFLSRNRVPVAVAAVVVLLVTASASYALVQGRRAQHRFEELRSFAHSVVFEMSDAIVGVPGTTAARELLVRRSTQYLDALARDAGTDRGLLQELAAAQEKLGLLEGDRTAAHTGDLDSAEKNLRRAESLYQRLQDKTAAARVAGKLSVVFLARGNFPEAVAWAGKSGSDSDVCYALLQSGNLPGALQACEAHRAKLEKLPPNAANLGQLANFLPRLGQIQARSGQHAVAAATFQRATAIHQKLLAADPGNLTYKSELALDFQVLGRVASRRNPEAALPLFQKAMQLQSEVLEADSRNERPFNSLKLTISLLAAQQARLGNSKEALVLANRCLAMSEEMLQRNPSARAEGDLANAHDTLGDAWMAAHQKQKAMAEYRKGLEILQAMQRKNTLSIDDRQELGQLLKKVSS